jgi:short-subunit dehydrogenase
MKTFDNKVIIITGSSMGIGKYLAKDFLSKGAKVVINGRSLDKLNETAAFLSQEGLDVLAIQGDVSVLDDCKTIIQKTVDQFGKIDMLINMAGVNMFGTIEESDPIALKRIMDINYFGSLWPTQVALPFLKATKGNLLFISSIASFHGIPHHGVYSSSKRALTSLAETLKIELHDTGIHVGIAYVGLTEVEPDKKVYDRNGNPISRPVVGGIKKEPIETASKEIVRMIENRTFKSVFSTMGRINALVNRISPSIVSSILLRNFKKGQT